MVLYVGVGKVDTFAPETQLSPFCLKFVSVRDVVVVAVVVVTMVMMQKIQLV